MAELNQETGYAHLAPLRSWRNCWRRAWWALLVLIGRADAIMWISEKELFRYAGTTPFCNCLQVPVTRGKNMRRVLLGPFGKHSDMADVIAALRGGGPHGRSVHVGITESRVILGKGK